ncbi:26087_t:CDS:2 [Gigaspora margarita]|uniref:26087_t:CDS:1 n=1 Tax=Gigaspora margarita TaxID=4874 RepID=A0ABN7URZ7_GIGMA|nr:26087_t:CDS:2 [Gigaspora margarita]
MDKKHNITKDHENTNTRNDNATGDHQPTETLTFGYENVENFAKNFVTVKEYIRKHPFKLGGSDSTFVYADFFLND